MKRVALTDQSGKWFDEEKCIVFQEATRWDGRNHISIPTGSQWEHEQLLYTRSRNWIKHSWSQWQGSLEQYTEISPNDAIHWLVVNEHADSEQLKLLPKSVLDDATEYLAALEV